MFRPVRFSSKSFICPRLRPIQYPSRFQSSSSTTTSSASSHQIPNITHRKQKIDLRPAPIKLKSSTVSATRRPTLHPTSESPPTPSLGDVKETARRDIQDAEAHGILTPPPPDANWFKRTLHKGIQLAVRATFPNYFSPVTSHPEILLCGCETYFHPPKTNIFDSGAYQGWRQPFVEIRESIDKNTEG